MNRAAASVLYFGYYLVGLGIVVATVPNVLLSVFGFPSTSEVWIRVAGVLTIDLGYLYIQAARSGIARFFELTVHVRPFVFATFAAFVIAGLASPVLVLLGLIDLLGAVWTWRLLRSV